MNREKTLPVSCNRDCGAGCALEALVRDGRIIDIRDAEARPPYMRGCLKGYRSAETVYHRDRLTVPLIREGKRGSGQFREAGWDEALDLVAGKLEALRRENRLGEILRLGGSGSCRGALHNTALLPMRFLSQLGGYTETRGNYSSEASDYVKGPVFGTRYVGIDAKTLLHSNHIILWGFNPSDTRFDSETEAVLKEASERGIAITVIDPRETRSVRNFKARWIPLKPGTDSAFMLAILWTLRNEELLDRQSLEKYSFGFDRLEEYIAGKSDGIEKSPQWAESICGLSALEIRDFARSYGGDGTTALLPGLSLQRAIGGENTDRLGAVLQLATGNAGKPGGSTGAGMWNRLPKPRVGKITPVPNPLSYSVPVYKWADAVLEGREGGYPSDISFIYNVGGNYIGQGSDTARTIKAFEKADFSVTHDYFLTDTARHCDVVLPVTTYLEREDIVTTANNFLFYSAQAIEPVGEAKNDFAIFSELAERLGFNGEFTEGRNEKEWIEHCLGESEIPDVEDFMRSGVHAGAEKERIGLSGFFSDPLANRLDTPSGRIEIASEKMFEAGGTLLPEHILIETEDRYPLRMITPHEKYRVHSQNDNIPSLKKLCDDRLWMNKADAQSRGICDGDGVTVSSPDGNINVNVFVTDRICSGAVSLTQGVWASGSSKGANANFLTSTEPARPSYGSRTHSIIVEVVKSRT